MKTRNRIRARRFERVRWIRRLATGSLIGMLALTVAMPQVAWAGDKKNDRNKGRRVDVQKVQQVQQRIHERKEDVHVRNRRVVKDNNVNINRNTLVNIDLDRGRDRDSRDRDWERDRDRDRDRDQRDDQHWRDDRDDHRDCGDHRDRGGYDRDRRRDVHNDIDIDIHLGGGRRYWPPYHPYRPYCPPAPRVIYRPTVIVDRPVVEVCTPVVRVCPPTYKVYVECNGWDLLAQGRAYDALRFFEDQSYQYPNAGLPKAGMALARALKHDDYAAVEDLRYAFRIDCDSLDYLPVSEGLDCQLRNLIEHYEYKLSCEPYNDDWHFMLASISFFRHDYGRARHELSYLLSKGDVGYAVENLDRMIYEAEYH